MTVKVKSLLRKYHTKVNPETPLKRVWDLFSKRTVRLIPVVSRENILLGVIADEDLLFHLIPDYREYFSEFYPEAPNLKDLMDKLETEIKQSAADIMNKKVHTIDPNQEVFKALSKMIAYQVHQLPVVTEEGKYLGMIAEDDIFCYLYEKHKHVVRRKKKKS